MTFIEKTAYPRFTDELLSSEWRTYFLPTEEEVRFIAKHARTERGKLTLLILLKTHQYLGQTIPVHKVPKPIQEYLRSCMDLPQTIFPLKESPANKTSLHRYRAATRSYLQITPWSGEAEKIVRTAVNKAAYTMSDPADLINVALEALSDNRYELPAFSKLERLVKHIRSQVHKKIYSQIASRLNPSQRATLDKLLIVGEYEWQSDFTRMKATPGKATLGLFAHSVKKVKFINRVFTT